MKKQVTQPEWDENDPAGGKGLINITWLWIPVRILIFYCDAVEKPNDVEDNDVLNVDGNNGLQDNVSLAA